MVLTSRDKLKEKKEITFIGVILIKEESFLGEKKTLGRNKVIENANQTIWTLLPQNLIGSVFSRSSVTAKLQRGDRYWKGGDLVTLYN